MKMEAVSGAIGATTLLVGSKLAVAAIGFKTAGIAAGSYAAGMMSAAATAAGGGVASGSTVAILQSIGATGLGIVGLGTAATVGTIGVGFYAGYKVHQAFS